MQTRILKINDSEKRVETGPIQFNDDWPGLFIRGDSASVYAETIRQILKLTSDLDTRVGIVAKSYLQTLLELFEATNEKYK